MTDSPTDPPSCRCGSTTFHSVDYYSGTGRLCEKGHIVAFQLVGSLRKVPAYEDDPPLEVAR